MPEKKEYIRIIGKLLPDGTLKLKPCYLTDKPGRRPEEPEGEMTLEFFSDDGRLISREPISAKPYEMVDYGESANLAVRGRVPFPPAAALMRFNYKEKVVHEIKIPKSKPVVRINDKELLSRKMTGKRLVTWEGSHPEERALQYFLEYSNDDGKSWRRINMRTAKTEQELDLEKLPGGEKCRIAVIATDGINTSRSQSAAFSVPVKPCMAMILSPEDGATFQPGEEVLLRGQGFYLEEQAPETNELTWSSSIDGELGRGMSLLLKKLSTGVHKITLVAGKGRRAGKAVITVTVGRRR